MASDNSALSRRALAALILAESERNGGTRLPTERQLAADLGVSRSAVRHALAVLQAEGHVSREVGRGTFLRGPEPGGLPPADPAPSPGTAAGDARAAGGLPALDGRPGAADY